MINTFLTPLVLSQIHMNYTSPRIIIMGSSSGNQWKMEGLQGYTVSFYKDDSSHQQSFQQSERSYNNWEKLQRCFFRVKKKSPPLFGAPPKKNFGKTLHSQRRKTNLRKINPFDFWRFASKKPEDVVPSEEMGMNPWPLSNHLNHRPTALRGKLFTQQKSITEKPPTEKKCLPFFVYQKTACSREGMWSQKGMINCITNHRSEEEPGTEEVRPLSSSFAPESEYERWHQTSRISLRSSAN